MSDEIQYSPSRANNYKTIKRISATSGGLAVLLGFLSVLLEIAGLSVTFRGEEAGLYWPIVGGFGFASAVFCWFLSESVNVMLDIEANTRQAAKTLEQLLRSQE